MTDAVPIAGCELCPDCGRAMMRFRHGDEWKPDPKRAYYSWWDRCRHCKKNHYNKSARVLPVNQVAQRRAFSMTTEDADLVARIEALEKEVPRLRLMIDVNRARLDCQKDLIEIFYRNMYGDEDLDDAEVRPFYETGVSHIAELIEDIPEHNLKAGDQGFIMSVHGDGAAYDIEFAPPFVEAVPPSKIKPAEVIKSRRKSS